LQAVNSEWQVIKYSCLNTFLGGPIPSNDVAIVRTEVATAQCLSVQYTDSVYNAVVISKCRSFTLGVTMPVTKSRQLVVTRALSQGKRPQTHRRRPTGQFTDRKLNFK
jgi:hypothetical protein